MIAELEPIQEKVRELEAKPDYVKDVLAQGAKKCKTIAEETMAEVHKIMGLR